MKPIFLTIFSLICSQSSLCAHFNEEPQCEKGTKVYVLARDVRLTEGGIYLDVGAGQSVPIPNIQTDSRGLFTVVNQDQVKYTTYVCPGCKKIYSWWENCKTPGCPYGPPRR